MVTRLTPYLNFRQSAEEAITFYQSVFGGNVVISHFGDYGMEVPPEESDLVMHSQLDTPSGFTLMASDTPSYMELPDSSSVSVSLSGGDDATEELTGYWHKLLEGGSQTVPLEMAPWGDSFGMLTDKFGTKWLVNIAGPGQPQSQADR